MTTTDLDVADHHAAGSLADELPYWGWLPDDRTCLTRRGELVTLARLTPTVVDGHTPEQLDAVLNRWQRMLSGIDSRTRIYFYLLRRPAIFPDADTGLSAVADLGQRKRRAFLGSRIQQIDTYLAWCYDPRLSTAAAGKHHAPWWKHYVQTWMKGRRTPNEAIYFREQIEDAAARFRQQVDASRTLVADLTPLDILTAHEGSRLLAELVNKPGRPPWDGATGSGLNWRLAYSELEAERRHLRLDGEPVILYSLVSPPARATANLLNDLYRLDSVMTVALEWRPWDLDAARRKIRGAQRHYFSKRYSMMAHVQETEGTTTAMVDSAADVESGRLGNALVELETEGVAYGDLALTIALHGDLETTERLDGDLLRIFAAHDAKAIREGYGQLPAWFCRLPAQPRKRQVRSVFVSAGAAACLAPIYGPPTGSSRSRHLDRAALAILETQWQTPFHYDLFHGDVGHTLVLGATGAGKSFTLNFLLVQALQYNPRVLILDLGGSYRWITRFLGGGYMELSPDDATGHGGFRLRPFALPRTERSLQFLTGWIMRLLRIGGWTVTGSDPSEIRARIEDIYAFPPARRTMTVFVQSLPAAMWPAMGRWYGTGAWGRYFDNPAVGDDLELADWQVIDLAGAAEHEDLCEAALFYLLERLRLSLENPDETDRVKLMVVDEAWRYLRDPAVLAYLAEAAKTWRKKNAALIMATQSAVDVTGTAGAEALLESMPTKLFLANPELPDKAADLFRLNPSEVATIRGLVSKQELYLRRPNMAATVRLEVDPESYWLYTSSARDSARRAEAVEHSTASRRRSRTWPPNAEAHEHKRENPMTASPLDRCPCSRLLWIVPALALAQAPQADAPAPDAPAGASVLQVQDEPDQIIRVNTRIRHTTVIQLPAAETILDFIVGDSEYWHLTGAANLAFLKPIGEGVTTNVALVCESGRIYSFLVTEQSGPPHLIVRIGGDPNSTPASGHVPAFVARSRVAEYQLMAEESRAAVLAAQRGRRGADHRHAPGRHRPSRCLSRDLSHALAVPVRARGQGRALAVPGARHVARRAIYLRPIHGAGDARALREQRRPTVPHPVRP